MMNLIIDVGNTRVKAAVFESRYNFRSVVLTEKNFSEIKKILKKYTISQGILSSVSIFRKNVE